MLKVVFYSNGASLLCHNLIIISFALCSFLMIFSLQCYIVKNVDSCERVCLLNYNLTINALKKLDHASYFEPESGIGVSMVPGVQCSRSFETINVLIKSCLDIFPCHGMSVGEI